MIALGIDIGGTRIKAAMVDGDGRIVAAESTPTPPNVTEFRERIGELTSSLVAAAGHPRGVGVGCKGVIEPETTRIAVLPGTLHFLEGLRLADMVPLAVPVRADNDARVAMAGAEAGSALFDPLEKQIWQRSRGLLARDVPIVPPAVADKSGVVGAAALVFAGP